MKIKTLEGWPPYWVTPYGNVDWDAPVARGILKEIYPWAKGGDITLVVDCRDSKYYGAIKIESDIFQKLNKVLNDNIGRPIKDIINMEILTD